MIPGTFQTTPHFAESTDFDEITIKEREERLSFVLWKMLTCYRHESSFEACLDKIRKSQDSENLIQSKLRNLIERVGKCKHFTRYIPSYNPLQQLMRWEAIEREHSKRRWKIIYLILGVLLGLAAWWIKNLIFGD